MLTLLKRDLPEVLPVDEKIRAAREAEGSGKTPRIRCPRCRWQPRKDSRWQCSRCATTWNTFDTQGKCPGCGYQWVHTRCLRCLEWSPHLEWYEKPQGPEAG